MIYDLSKLDGTIQAQIMLSPKYTEWFIEPHAVVVALYAKGKAKKDTSGFVVD